MKKGLKRKALKEQRGEGIDELKKILDIKSRFISIIAEKAETTSIVLKDGKVKDISSGRNFGIGIRMLNKTFAYASANTLKEAYDAAKRAARFSEKSKSDEKIELKEKKAVKDKREVKQKIKIENAGFEDKIKILRECHSEIKDDKAIVSSSFSYFDSIVEKIYIDSEGSEIETKEARVAIFATAFAKENGSVQIGSERAGATSGLEVFENAGRLARKACEKAKLLLKAKLPPSGEFDVILDPKLTGVFIHEALGHAVEADHVIKGESILQSKIGTEIASSIVNVCDNPCIDKSFGFYFYDDEGVKACKTRLIENGMLKTYLHSRETAARLNSELTANARAQSYAYEPIVRMSNTYIEPGEHRFEEMIEELKNGVFLLGSKGGEVDPARGVFQFAAEHGFIVEKGMIKHAIKDVALSGETLEILKNIRAISKDFELSVGFCGKEMQSVAVGDGSANVLTRAIVGGAT